MGTVVILVMILVTALLILLGRKIESPIIPGGLTIFNLLFLVYHSIKLDKLENVSIELINEQYYYLAVGFILLLVSFIAYLWIDDIAAKKKNKKSYDDSLSWFWDKI